MKRIWALLIMGGFFLGMILCIGIGTLTHIPTFEYLAYAMAVGFVISWLSIRCPNCGRILGRNLFSNYCPHCGESL